MKLHKFRGLHISSIVSVVVMCALLIAYTLLLRRPYWVASTDVEWDFLFRGLAIAQGHFFPHGFGVLVDVTGGAFAALLSLDLTRMGTFVAMLRGVGLLVTLGAGALFVRTRMRSLSTPLGLAIFLFIFLNPSARLYLPYWSADMLVVPFAIFAFVSFERSLRPGYRVRRWPLLWAGVWGGLAIALKPYLFVLVASGGIVYLVRYVVQKRNKPDEQRMAFVYLAYTYGVGLIVGGVIGFLPFVNNPHFIVGFFLERATGSSLGEIFSHNLGVLISAAPLWAFAVFVVEVWLLALFPRLVCKRGMQDVLTLQALFTMIAIALGTMFALVQPNAGAFNQQAGVAVRFFLPVAFYVVVGVSVLVQWYVAHLLRRWAALMLCVVALLLVVSMRQDYLEQRAILTRAKQVRAVLTRQIEEFTARRGRPPQILLGDIPIPVVALSTGDQYTQGMFRKEIAALYPYEGYKNFSSPLIFNELVGYDLLIVRREEVRLEDLHLLRKAGYQGIAEDTLFVFERIEQLR